MKRLIVIAGLSLLSTVALSMDNAELDKQNSFDFVVKLKKQLSQTTKKTVIKTKKGKFIKTSTRTFYDTCSAIVIDKNILLTAGHCCYHRGEFVANGSYEINTGKGSYVSNKLTCVVPQEYSKIYKGQARLQETLAKQASPDQIKVTNDDRVLLTKSQTYDVGVVISQKSIFTKKHVRLIINDPIFSSIVNDPEYNNEVRSNSFVERMLVKSIEFFKKYHDYTPVIVGMGSYGCNLLPSKFYNKSTCKQSETRKWKKVKLYIDRNKLGGNLKQWGNEQFILLLNTYLDDGSLVAAPGDSGGGALVLVDPSGVDSPILIGIASAGGKTATFSSLLMNGQLVFDAMKKNGSRELPLPWIQSAEKYQPVIPAVSHASQDRDSLQDSCPSDRMQQSERAWRVAGD